jgi:PPM family protein phosphatase
MVLRLRYAAVSDVGMIRQVNEDSGFAGPDLLLLADGMGGHAGGEVASAAAVDSLRDLRAPADGSDPTETVRSGVAAAGDSLRALVRERPELEGMGTTLTLLLRSGSTIAIAQVGDSRGYLLRDGVLERVTRDQTFVQSLIDQGRISDEEAKNHPQRNLLLQALDGRVEVEPEVELRTAKPGDRYLLCSDGLTLVVTEPTIRDVLQEGTPAEAAERLVDLALRAGAPDNVTCLVADVVDEEDGVQEPHPVVVGAAAASERARAAATAVPEQTGAGADVHDPEQDDEHDDADDHDGDELDGDPDGTKGGRRHRGRTGRGIAGLGLVLPIVLLLIVAAGAAYAGYRWTQNQYYVGVDDGTVAIYRGVPQQIVGRSLSSVVEPTDVQASALPSFAQSQVHDTIAADSIEDAHRIVDQLRAQSSACAVGASTDGCPPDASAGSSATTTATPGASPGATPGATASGSATTPGTSPTPLTSVSTTP